MKTILVIEDEVSTWMGISAQIECLNDAINVARVTGAIGTVSRWLTEQGAPDLAIVDLQLPRRNGIQPDGGFEAIKTIREFNSNIPVIVLTGRHDGDAFEKAQQTNSVQFFITKPWEERNLRQAITECLAGYRGDMRTLGS